jgi:hypothetical protein
MTIRRLSLALLLSASGLITLACNPFDNSSSPSTSTTPTTDTFNGALAPNGSLVFTFTVTTAGSVGVTLTTVSPPTASPLGLGIGPSSNGSCSITNSTSGAVAGGNAQLSANENPGTYCVRVSDAGSLAVTSAVTVTVNHS